MIGIAGASGLIGYNFYRFLNCRGYDTIGTFYSNRKDGLVKFNLTSKDFSLFNNCSQVIIAAAVSNIDKCFIEKDKVRRINVESTIELIKYLSRKKIKPVFLSTDQVFDGEKGNYSTEDKPRPLNCYGNFKLQVEEFMKKNLQNYLILRLSKTYSRNLNEKSIFSEIYLSLSKNIKIEAAYNQIFNPTDVSMLCEMLIKALDLNLSGVYHIAEPKIISRHEFAVSVAQEFGFDKDLIIPADIRTLSFLKDTRPLNTSLIVSDLR